MGCCSKSAYIALVCFPSTIFSLYHADTGTSREKNEFSTDWKFWKRSFFGVHIEDLLGRIFEIRFHQHLRIGILSIIFEAQVIAIFRYRDKFTPVLNFFHKFYAFFIVEILKVKKNPLNSYIGSSIEFLGLLCICREGPRKKIQSKHPRRAATGVTYPIGH